MTPSALAMLIVTWAVILWFTVTTFVAVVRGKSRPPDSDPTPPDGR